MEFKNEKWEFVDHSWSDTSIKNQDGKTICTLSIDDEDPTEENQVSEIFNLIACAPELLNELQNIIKEYDLDIVQGIDARKIRELIKKATTI